MNSRTLVRTLALATFTVAAPLTLSAQGGWNLPTDRERMIRVGETKNSSLDSRDRTLDDGSYVENWFFEGRAGQRISVTMRAAGFDTYLAVGRQNAELIESNDDFEEGSTHSRVTITLPADGMYVFRANSLGAGQTGDYTISLESGSGGGNAGGGGSSGGGNAAQRILNAPINGARMITPGRQVSSALDDADGRLDDNSFFEVWYVQLSAGQSATITMRAGGFDTFMTLGQHGANATIESNDDFEEGRTDSRIEYTATAAGTYVIIANSLEAGKTGSYTIDVVTSGGSNAGGVAGDMMGGAPAGKGSGTSGVRTISAGQTMSSDLSSTDERLEDGSYYELWIYQGRAGESVTVTLRSSAFDAFLSIRNAQGEITESNDDDGGGANGTDSQVTVTVPANGRLIIMANTLTAGETGAYTLSLTRGN